MEQQRNITDNLEKRKTDLPGEDYFAALKSSVLESTHPVKMIPIYRKSWFISSAAAVLIVIFTLPFLLKNETQNAQPDWNSVNKDELFAYVNENIEDFDTEDIASQFTQLPAMENDVELNPEASLTSNQKTEELFESLDKEEILEYLEEEVVDIDDESITGY